MQTLAIQTGVNFVFYGVQSALFIAAISMLSHHKARFRLLIAAIIALFISSTIGVVVQTVIFVIQFPTGGLRPPPIVPLIRRLNILMNVSHRFNYLVGDAIVVWRAWIVWPDSRLARGLLFICMCGSTSGIVLNSVWQAEWTLHDDVGRTALERTLTVTVPLLVTNMLATVLMALQVWSYRRYIKASLGSQSRLNKVEGTVLMLVESGLLYCALWVLFLVTGLREPTPDRINTYDVIQPAYHTIAGIYPTFIVLVVATRRSTAESFLSHSSDPASGTLRFTPGVASTSQDPGQTTSAYDSMHMTQTGDVSRVGSTSYGAIGMNSDLLEAKPTGHVPSSHDNEIEEIDIHEGTSSGLL